MNRTVIAIVCAVAIPFCQAANPQLPERLFRAPAIASAYQPVLTTEEKVAGLSLFWSEARRNFVYFDHVPQLQWDQVYLDYLGKVIAASTTEDYYRVMMTLAPLLQDSHTAIVPPAQVARLLYARPPVHTALIEDKVMVVHVGAADVAARIKSGDEIVAIDGQPVRDYARTRIAPYVSASTAQDRAERTFNYQLLHGDAERAVALTLRAADGGERIEMVARSGPGDAPPAAGFRQLDGGMVYIALDQFENDADVQVFKTALPQILAARGLVIDVRRNGGGSALYALQVLSHLTRAPIRMMDAMSRNDDIIARAQGRTRVDWTRVSGGEYSLPQKQVFEGPVVVLTSARTISAAEDFIAMFRLMQRGIIVGETTGGSTGQPLVFALPGGGSAFICIKRDVYADGSTFVGQGIAPDVEVRQTIAALRVGRDLALERAGAELRKR